MDKSERNSNNIKSQNFIEDMLWNEDLANASRIRLSLGVALTWTNRWGIDTWIKDYMDKNKIYTRAIIRYQSGTVQEITEYNPSNPYDLVIYLHEVVQLPDWFMTDIGIHEKDIEDAFESDIERHEHLVVSGWWS